MSDIKPQRAKRNDLGLVNSARLLMLIEAEYRQRRVSDIEFALYAQDKLGVPIKASNVSYARNKLGIKGTLDVVAEENRAKREAEKLAKQQAAAEKKASSRKSVIAAGHARKEDVETLNKLIWELEKRVAALEERQGK